MAGINKATIVLRENRYLKDNQFINAVFKTRFSKWEFEEQIGNSLHSHRLTIAKNVKNQVNMSGKGFRKNTKAWIAVKTFLTPHFGTVKGRFSTAMLQALADRRTVKVSGWNGDYGPVHGHMNKIVGGRYSKKPVDAIEYLFRFEREKAGGKLIDTTNVLIKKLEESIADKLVKLIVG